MIPQQEDLNRIIVDAEPLSGVSTSLAQPRLASGALQGGLASDSAAKQVVQELNVKNVVITQCIPKTTDVIVYDNLQNNITRETIEFSSFIGIDFFLVNCAYINVAGKLYISGGINGVEASDSFLVYDRLDGSMTKLPEMLNPRHSHSMYFYNDTIYVVGGSINQAEKFDLNTLKWTKLTALLSERYNPVIYVHNNFLYAFFGESKGKYLETIEKLNIKNVKSKWEVVPFKKLKSLDLKMIGCGIIPSSEREIYMFGGKGIDGLRKSAIKFDFGNNTFDRLDLNLEDGIYFHESVLANLGENSYGQFNMDKNENFFKIQIG